MIIFGSVRFLLKNIQNRFFGKQAKLVQTDRFRFGYFGEKTGSNRPARFFSVWFWFGSVFFRFGLVFLVSSL